MKPHMAHIAQTMNRVKENGEVSNLKKSYERYKDLVETARSAGYTDKEIVDELIFEKVRVQNDIRRGDELFELGVKGAKQACMKAIDILMSELKGEQIE